MEAGRKILMNPYRQESYMEKALRRNSKKSKLPDEHDNRANKKKQQTTPKDEEVELRSNKQ